MTISRSPFIGSSTLPPLAQKVSPIRTALILILLIFLSELIAMGILRVLSLSNYLLASIVDGLIMLLLISPGIYYLQVKPLLMHIDERQQAEKALLANEDLLRRILEMLPVGVWITDKDGMVVHGNLASRQIWAGARYVGVDDYGEYKAWWVDTGDLIQPEEWAATRAIRHGVTVQDEEVEIECFDGTRKIILNSAAPMYQNENIQGAIVVNQDITERKRAEQALKKSETMFKTAFQILPVGAWLADANGKIVFGNPAGQEIWAGAKYIGIEQFGEYKAWWLNTGEVLQPDDWAIARAIKNGETSLNEELEIECFDGAHKIILNTAIPIRDDNGNLHGVFAVNEDITQRKRAEQELIHSHQLIQKAFNSIDILIAYMDREFNFIQVNEAYASYAGHPVKYFENKNHFDLYPHEENQRIFQRVVDTGEPFSVLEKPFEYQEYPERGVTYWNWSLQPVQGGDGKVQGVVLSLVDVSERKRAEMLLEHQNQELYNLSVSESVQRELAEGLVESMLVLNASLELDEVLKTILEQILRSIPYDFGNILLLDEGKLTEVRYLDTLENPQQKFSAGNTYQVEDIPLFQAICSTHQPVLVEDTGKISQAQSAPGMYSSGSYMAAPMLIGDRVIGIIGLSSRTPGDFNQAYSRRLVAFITPAALAVENARLYSAELHARQVAETLSTAAKSLNQTLDFEQALGILLDHLQTIVPSDTAGITILENQTRPSFHLIRGYGEWSGQEPKPSLIIDGFTDSLLSRLQDSRRSLIIPNLINPPAQEEVVSPGLLHYQLVVPIFFSGELIGIVELGKAGSQGFTPEQLQWAEALTDQAAVSLQNAWLYEQVRSKNETLKSLAHKLVEVQETERSYVARELHDEAGQVLSSLKIHLGRLEQDPLCPPIIQDGLRSLKSTTDSVLDEIHRLAMNLRPAVLDHLGLVAALEQHIKRLQSEQLMVSFKAIGFEERRLPPDTETALYRIIQEALTNVRRHAQATSAGVLLEWCKEGMVRAFIEDDGTGFSQAPEEKVDRIGLIGMRERAEMLSGRLSVESSPGKGTSIVVEVPDGY